MSLRSDYAKLRHAQQNRIRRAEQAGFRADYVAPPTPDLTERQLKREYAKLQRWMADPGNLLAGRRIEKQIADEERERRRLRKNEQERERYRKRREAEGKTVRPKGKKRTPEEQRQYERERKRAYRQRKREERESGKALAAELAGITDKKVKTALENLLSGLKKYGITVKSLKELQAWGDYIAERQRDADNNVYMFDLWLDEVESALDKPKTDLTGKDVERLMQDFAAWQTDKANLDAEFTRERQSNEYSYSDLGDLFGAFLSRR